MLVACLMAAYALHSQPAGMRGMNPGTPRIELKGKIERVQIVRAQGMPLLIVRVGDKSIAIVLGSMRYLMEQDFNPKSGEDVVVSGYKMNDSVLAATVTLPATGKALKLRDESGRPLWMGGRRGMAPPGTSPQ
jgi:hypothetical protein